MKHISILIPTYNRPQFIELVFNNLVNQTYPPELLEVVIDDDGEYPLIPEERREMVQKCIAPITLKYIYNPERRRTIGEKRNRLVQYATHDIVCFMDDDDYYHPHYIKHSYDILSSKNAGLVGSNAMIFCYPLYDFKITAIQTKYKNQIHEATMMMTKKFWKEQGGFKQTSRGEGGSLLGDRTHDVELTNINMCMVCMVHHTNTIDKAMFMDAETNIKRLPDENLISLMKGILKI